MWFLKNRKGQAIVEAVIVMNLLLMIFFAMILFSVYIYDKMVVVFAANLAIDEAIGKIPEAGITRKKVEDLMSQSAYGALNLGIFLKEQNVVSHVYKPPKGKTERDGEINVTVTARYSINLPLVSQFLNNNLISHTAKVDYSW